MGHIKVITGDCRDVLRTLPEQSVNCVVTSPPYFGLRDYGVTGQIGLEQTPDEYVAEMVAVFREARRVMRDDGTLFLNLGDSYNNRTRVRGSSHQPGLNGVLDVAWADTAAGGGVRMSNMPGLKEKDLIGIPWRVAFALQADGWYLRQDIIWAKPNPMPESVQDRCTKAHEYVFLLSKGPRYHFDAAAIAEASVDPEGSAARYKSEFFVGKKHEAGGYGVDGQKHTAGMKEFDGTRNKRSVWTIATRPFADAHFATMAPDLARTCIMAGCPLGGTVLDPFGGAGTTGMVADQLSRNAILIELNPTYADLARKRIADDAGMFVEVA